MPRLTNKVNGVTVNVDEETALRLTGNWVDSREAETADAPDPEQQDAPETEPAAQTKAEAEPEPKDEPETAAEAEAEPEADTKPARRGRRNTN